MARSHCCAVVVTASTPWSSARSATTPSDAGAHDRHAAYFLALAVAQVYNFLGQVRLTKGDPDVAARPFTKGLTAARRASERLSILISLYDLALSSQAWGDLSGAAEHLTEGLSLAAEAGTRPARRTTSRPWPQWPARTTTRSAPPRAAAACMATRSTARSVAKPRVERSGEQGIVVVGGRGCGGHLLEGGGHGLQLDRQAGAVLVRAPAARDDALGEVRGGAEVGRGDEQLEPDEPACLDRIHRHRIPVQVRCRAPGGDGPDVGGPRLLLRSPRGQVRDQQSDQAYTSPRPVACGWRWCTDSPDTGGARAARSFPRSWPGGAYPAGGIAGAATARGKMNSSIALAKPSSSLEAVT